MRRTKTWKEVFENKAEDDDSWFGCNCFVDNKKSFKYLSRLDKLGAYIVFRDYKSIFVALPKDLKQREKIFLHIIKTSPIPTNSMYVREQDVLELEWK